MAAAARFNHSDAGGFRPSFSFQLFNLPLMEAGFFVCVRQKFVWAHASSAAMSKQTG
jgi:hypothetical protein